MNMALFEVRNVSKIYRPGARNEVRALDDVSLTIEPGSFTALIGPSGSGKTTLLGLLGAMARPSQGQILFAERDLSKCSDVELARTRRRMGFVFQDFSLIPSLPVWENITYPLIPRGVGRADRHQRAGQLLERLGLADKMGARPCELSGGEQQRVALARALAVSPEVLLADEPTSNLDQAAAGMFAALLKEIHQEGKTIILGTHDPLLIGLARNIRELKAGKLLQ